MTSVFSKKLNYFLKVISKVDDKELSRVEI